MAMNSPAQEHVRDDVEIPDRLARLLQTENEQLQTSSTWLKSSLRECLELLSLPAVLTMEDQHYLNAAAQSFLECGQEVVLSQSSWHDRFKLFSLDQHFDATNQTENLELFGSQVYKFCRSDGEIRLFERRLLVDNKPQELYLLRDLTNIIRRLSLLEQSARTAQIGGWEIDIATRKVYWTSETYRIHDLTPEEYSPSIETLPQFYMPWAAPIIRKAIERGMNEGVPHDLELELITAKQRRVWVRTQGIVDFGVNGPIKLYGSLQDISRLKVSEEALRLSESEKRRLIESSPDCLLELNFEGRIQSINPRGRELLNLGVSEPILGRYWHELWSTECQKQLQEALEAARQSRESYFQLASTNRDGKPCWWDIRLTLIEDTIERPIRLLVSARDITEFKQAEIERESFQRNLLQTQKLESLGVLAGGIAHDFNNLLTGILGNAELIKLMSPDHSSVLESVRQIEEATKRAADLCRQMLAYAGKGQLLIRPVNLSLLVNESANLLRLSAVSKKATLTFTTRADLPFIRGDATQLRQVLMNLVINASEALGDQEGLIAVSTGLHSVQDGSLRDVVVGDPVVENELVYLEVSDTGCGMDESTRSRIFEPFFTTKFTGRGLGLSAVLGIVRSHHGILTLRSTPGKGSTFRLYFPAVSQLSEHSRSSDQGQLNWSENGLVIIADDEETVLDVANTLVRSFGFDTLIARDGFEAVQLIGKYKGQIRLALLDLTMPRLDGEQMLEEVRRLAPNLPIILMSGFHQLEVHERFATRGISAILPKPFSRSLLGRKIREALQAQASSGRQIEIS